MVDADEKSWFEYRRLVMGELERISRQITMLESKIDGQKTLRDAEVSELRVKIGMLEVKAGIYGALSGLLVAIGTVLMSFFMRGGK